MAPEPLRLKDAFKQYKHDQDKIIISEKTVERFKQRLADNKLDILDDIVRVDKGRLDIPVYFSVCGPQARAAIGNYKRDFEAIIVRNPRDMQIVSFHAVEKK